MLGSFDSFNKQAKIDIDNLFSLYSTYIEKPESVNNRFLNNKYSKDKTTNCKFKSLNPSENNIFAFIDKFSQDINQLGF